MTRIKLLAGLSGLFLAACGEAPLQAVGQLESDRIELVAEWNEAITAIEVLEGMSVEPGAVVVRQDPSRLQIRVQQASANVDQVRARLQELLNGPRPEIIDATRANLTEALIERHFRERELARLEGLRESNLTSVESVDTARKLLETAAARIEFVTAQLAELQAGTRIEQIDQARAQLQQAETSLASLELDLSRLTITAPVAGIVDSLPFEIGERPRAGDVVAVLLGGDQPYARVYIPEPLRLGLETGSVLPVQIDGMENTIDGRVRRIAAEPAFTPYFALTERDRSRLSYVAEISLPNQNRRLPEGLPVQVLLE
ncbi:MAG: HlyD family efflux transporter periplasmic adaptor subunit [Gammaproteobacteria bacterium]